MSEALEKIFQTTEWLAMVKQMKSTVDRLGEPIDQGIFDLVVVLNLLGIPTVASCEGHLDHGLISPWVDISVEHLPEYKELYSDYQRGDALILEMRKKDPESKTLVHTMKEINSLRRQLIQASNKQTSQLVLYLQSFYATKTIDYEYLLVLRPLGLGSRLMVSTEYLYEGLSHERRAEFLSQAQQEFNEFTEYLKLAYLH